MDGADAVLTGAAVVALGNGGCAILGQARRLGGRQRTPPAVNAPKDRLGRVGVAVAGGCESDFRASGKRKRQSPIRGLTAMPLAL